MKKILIDEEIRNSLLKEFGVCVETLRSALYFREKRRNPVYLKIRERALELGGIQVELVHPKTN
jgi:hypothetical protein